MTRVLRKCKPEIKGGKEKKHRTEYWQVAEEVKKPRLISAGGKRKINRPGGTLHQVK